MKKRTKTPSIDFFDFPPGTLIANKFEIVEKLGGGWEGEVYRIVELGTDIERAAKFFYPQRNEKNRVATRYAKMLHQLSNCPIVIHYHTHEFLKVQGIRITALISEYVEGELLSTFLQRQPGKRIGVFRGLHLLHALISGLESMHNIKTYHGDLHTENIIIKRYGLGFELKLLDMYQWQGVARRVNMEDDICDSIKIFYDAIGGKKHYAKQPKEVKQLCRGLKRSLILEQFPTAAHLRDYLTNIEWRTPYREPQ